MKRNLSVEDLFGKSDSESDSDRTLDEKPRNKNSLNLPSSMKSGQSKCDSTGIKSNSENSNYKEGKMATNIDTDSGRNAIKKPKTCEILDSESSTGSMKCKNSEEWNEAGPSGLRANRKFTSEKTKPICQYGKRCYRKNPNHFDEFDHPEGSMFLDEVSSLPKKQRLNDEAEVGAGVSDARATDAGALCYSLLPQSEPFSFFLTKVHGIDRKFNSVLAMDIKDILSPSHGILQKSAQFNYCIDIPWLVSRYPPEFRDRPLLIVHGEKGTGKIDLQEAASRYDNVRLCQAPLDIAYGTHHTKMMLLLYDAGLRVVIHTANLVDGDWYQKTQGIWLSPIFPKLNSKESGVGESTTNFKRDLVEYLKAYRQRSLDEWVATIQQFDMSSAKVVLIGSVPGRHSGEMKSHFGHLKLRKVLEESGPDVKSVSKWSVVGQFSSVGSLGSSSDAWLTSEWLQSLSAAKGCLSEKANLKLVFPSKENVRCSLEGYPAGASIPYSIHTAKKQPYFNSYLHQWKASCRGRSRASPHIKTYTRASEDGNQIAWCLVTSSNLSKAAWGSLEKNGMQLFIRSYELGVLFLPQHFGMDMFSVMNQMCKSGSFPFPFDLPPTPYATDDRPWIWDIPYMDKPDTNGNAWVPS